MTNWENEICITGTSVMVTVAVIMTMAVMMVPMLVRHARVLAEDE